MKLNLPVNTGPRPPLRATVHCDRCDKDLVTLEARSWEQLAYAVGGLLVTTHAAIPHTSHGMSVRYGHDLTVGAFERPLVVECLHEHCGAPKRSEWADVPIELVAAYVIAFHTAHEGHRLRCKYGELEWASPAPIDPEDDA